MVTAKVVEQARIDWNHDDSNDQPTLHPILQRVCTHGEVLGTIWVRVTLKIHLPSHEAHGWVNWSGLWRVYLHISKITWGLRMPVHCYNTCQMGREPDVQSPALCKPSRVVHAFNPCTGEVEGGPLEVQCHPQLHREAAASLNYERLCQKQNKQSKIKQTNIQKTYLKGIHIWVETWINQAVPEMWEAMCRGLHENVPIGSYAGILES